MFVKIDVELDERAVVYRHGLPIRAVGPGRTWVWGFGLEVTRMSTKQLCFDALPEVRAVLPASWYREVTLAEDQRGVLYRNGRPAMYLRPGTWFHWTLDPSVELRVYSTDAPMPTLTDELLQVIPSNEIALFDVPAHAKGLFFVGEALANVLPPGRYAHWKRVHAPVAVKLVDVRRQLVTLAPQELMTRDKVTLRLSLTAEFTIEDVVKATIGIADAKDALYVLVQLAARDYVGSVTLDELLEAREAMTAFLVAQVVPKAGALGLRVERVGVKDVVLPGEMKTLLNRVIEAEKEAAANVILRREEVAATRLRASSARMMAEQPVLLRLTELEMLKDVAKSVGDLRIVVGSEGLERLVGARSVEAGVEGVG